MMVSYVTSVIVAMCLVFGLYIGIEMTTGNPVFIQDQLETKTGDQLREIASELGGKDQLEAIIQLGNRPGDLSKTVPILATLSTIPNELLKNAADASLEEIGAPAAEHIKEFFAEDTTKGYRAACSAASAIGPSCKIYMDEIKLLLIDENPIHRKCGLYALQGMGDEAKAAMEEIIVCVGDADLNNQCSACRILEKFGADAIDAEAALLKLQAEGGPSTRGWAALCLGAIGPTSSDVNVAKLLAKQLEPRTDGRPLTPTEQERVLGGLAYLGPEATDVVDSVRAKLKDKNTYVRCHAAYAIWKINGDKDSALAVLKDALTQPEYAEEAIFQISRMGEAAAGLVPDVASGLTSTEAGTREMAVVAMGNMGPAAKAYLEPVKERLKDTDALVRLAARRAVRQIVPDEKGKEDEEKNDEQGK